MSKVSVIIPVYNVEKYLRQCLDSVVNQTLTDIEIICVNDCSPDNSLSILQEYAQKDKRIKIINLKENVGVGRARNIALKHVTSDYVMYLDSDDWYELNACELAYNQIVKNDNDLVFFGMYIYDDLSKTKKNDQKRLNRFDKKHWSCSCLRFTDMDTQFMSNCECFYKIYKKKLIEDNNLYFEAGKCYEDMTFYYNLILSNPTFSILDVPLYNYRIRASQITQNSHSWDDLLFVRKKCYETMLRSENSKYINFYVIAYIRSLRSFYLRYKDKDVTFAMKHYFELRNIFENLNKAHDIKNIKEYIDYDFFVKIINLKYFWKILAKNIFSISNTYNDGEKHKQIIIFGKKIS